MLNVQKNIASTMQNLATEILEIKDRLAVLVQMYGTEGMATLTDQDYQALPEFAHITVAEMTGGKNAFDAINTAIGDYSAGTSATRLAKIVATVPR